jgi:hypothetical protein
MDKKEGTLGTSNTLLKELLLEDCASYCNHLRVISSQFKFLFRKVEGDIQRNETVMRTPLSAKLKLEITLHYLATGDSFSSLQFLYHVPKTTICRFIPEDTEAIYSALKEYVQVRIK